MNENAKLMNDKKKCKNFAKRKEKKLEEVKNDLNNLTTFIKKLVNIEDIKEDIKSQARKLIENLSSAKSNTEQQRKSHDNKSYLSDKLLPNSPEKDNSKNTANLDLNIQNEKEQENLSNTLQESDSVMPIYVDQIMLISKSPYIYEYI